MVGLWHAIYVTRFWICVNMYRYAVHIYERQFHFTNISTEAGVKRINIVVGHPMNEKRKNASIVSDNTYRYAK